MDPLAWNRRDRNLNDFVTGTDRPAAPRRGRRLGTHLLLLAAACIVPLLIFGVTLLEDRAATEYESSSRQVQDRARLLAESIDRELYITRAAGEVLAASSTLADGDLARFYEEAGEVRDRLGTNVVLRDLASQQLVNTRVPWGTPLPSNPSDVDQRVVETRQTQVAGLFHGALLRQPMLIVVSPVLYGETVWGLLSLTVPPERMSAIVAPDRLPEGWTATIFDQNGTPIAGTRPVNPDSDPRIPAATLRQLAESGDGVSQIRNLDGITVLQSYSRTRLAGWVVGVNVPEHLVAAVARHEVRMLTAGGIGMLILGLAIAAALGRRLTRPIIALAAAAEDLGEGKRIRLPTYGITEIDVVGRAYGVASDLIEKRTNALRASESRYARLANVTREGVAIHCDGRIIEANTRFAQMMGCTLDDVIGMPIHIFLPDRTENLRDEPSHSTDQPREMQGRRKDGSTFPVEVSGGSVEHDGRPMRVDLIRDLSAQKYAEAALRDAEARQRELQSELLHVSRLTEMGHMAAALAHEINQPLASVANYLGGCRLLLAEPHPEPQQLQDLRTALALANEQAVHAGEVVRRLRDFISKGETERQVVSAKEVLEQATELALVGARQRGITVRRDFAMSARVLVDRVQIQQVLVNLLRNAMDAMRDTTRKELDLRASESAEMVEVSVSDTGVGLAPEIAERLFEPFSSTNPQGMGIGLSVCRTIVEAHGGRISATPRTGGGTTFRFTIPVVREDCHAA